jgi:hypothetical protein
MAADTSGNAPAVLTIFLGIFSWIFKHVGIGDLAACMSVTVGLYSLFINWPKFKERWVQQFKKRN